MTDIDTAALRAAAENPMRMQTFDGRVTEWVSTSPAVVLALLDRLAAAEGAVPRAAETLDDLALTLMSTSDDNPTGDRLTAAVVSKCAAIVRQHEETR